MILSVPAPVILHSELILKSIDPYTYCSDFTISRCFDFTSSSLI